MALHYTYDPTSDRGRVRSKIGDATQVEDAMLTGQRKTWPCIEADEEIDVALADNGGDVLLASASLLRAIAADRVKTEAAIRIGNSSRDPRGMAKELRAQADDYERQALETPFESVTEQLGTDFQIRDYLLREALEGRMPELL